MQGWWVIHLIMSECDYLHRSQLINFYGTKMKGGQNFKSPIVMKLEVYLGRKILEYLLVLKLIILRMMGGKMN